MLDLLAPVLVSLRGDAGAGFSMPETSNGEPMKECTKCAEEKPLDEFSRDPRKSCGRKSQCRVCDNARRAAYRRANIEKEREADRAYRESRDLLEYAEQWRAENPNYHAKWRAENPGFAYASRARAFGFDPVAERFTRSDIVAYWGNGERCIYCDGPFQEIDHMIPVGLGGHHVISNVAPSCVPCNRQNVATVRRARQALAA